MAAPDPAPPAKRRTVRFVASVLVGVFVAYWLLTFALVWQATGWEASGTSEAIVVLGAAQYNGQPSPVLKARLDHAFALWKQGVSRTVVLTGSKRSGDRFTEAYAGLKYLKRKGVPEAKLVVVSTGTSTFESMAASVRVLAKRSIHSIVMVSDPYHSYRLVGVCEEVGFTKCQVDSTDADSSFSALARESVAVGLGRIIGYRRVTRLFDG